MDSYCQSARYPANNERFLAGERFDNPRIDRQITIHFSGISTENWGGLFTMVLPDVYGKSHHHPMDLEVLSQAYNVGPPSIKFVGL